MILTYKFRLKDKHAAELNRQARAVNYVWNYCNETQQKAARDGRQWLSFFDLVKLTSGSSKMLDIHAHTIDRVCHQYAFSRAKRCRPWLRWRGRRSLGWVPYKTGSVTFDGRFFKFRGVRYEPMHLRVMPKGVRLRAGSFNADARGKWHLNACFEVEASTKARDGKIGIDLGLSALATLSDGRKVLMPRFYRLSEQTLASSQRANKTKRVCAVHRKVANRRRDFMHKLSCALSKEYGLIVVGDVSPSKLAQTHLAKSVLDAGWSDLKRLLTYKSHLRGGRTVEVSERMTTQLCSSCGSLPPERPKGIAQLGIRRWTCGGCGTEHDRDVNAARNILARYGQVALAEGA